MNEWEEAGDEKDLHEIFIRNNTLTIPCTLQKFQARSLLIKCTYIVAAGQVRLLSELKLLQVLFHHVLACDADDADLVGVSGLYHFAPVRELINCFVKLLDGVVEIFV